MSHLRLIVDNSKSREEKEAREILRKFEIIEKEFYEAFGDPKESQPVQLVPPLQELGCLVESAEFLSKIQLNLLRPYAADDFPYRLGDLKCNMFYWVQFYGLQDEVKISIGIGDIY